MNQNGPPTAHGNVGGFVHSPESDINELKQKLKGYGSQEAFLKEILQNTDDARASLQRIIWVPGDPEAAHPLLRGPGLALINDRGVLRTEVEAIKRMGLGTKGAKQHAIGKFGQGIKTIFQVCEAFFLLASNPEAQEEDRKVLELCNPWFGWRHKEWNQFEAGDEQEILRRVEGLLPEGAWFLLYLPLRRKAHANPIVEPCPGEDTACPSSYRLQLTEDAPSLLPLLKTVSTVELYENWPNDSRTADLVVRLEKEGRRCVFAPDDRKNSNLQGSVAIEGAGVILVPFVGTTRWIESSRLVQLAKSELRPRIVGTAEDGQFTEGLEKAHPHAGISITAHPVLDAVAKCGKIELRWAVFLPVGGSPMDVVEWPTKLDLKIYLHGYFFLDATRTRVDGQDGATPFAEVEPRDEQSFCKQWNQVLAREGTLPLLPEVLQRVSRELLGGDLVQTTQLTRALESRAVFRQFRDAILRTHHWALTVSAGKSQWKALSAGKPILALPESFGGETSTILKALPGLATRAELAGAIPVIDRAYGNPGASISWLGRGSVEWTDNALAEAFSDVSADTYERNEVARVYALQFLRSLKQASRATLFSGVLADVRLFPAEELGGESSGLLSANDVRRNLEVGSLIAHSSDPELAKETADVVGRSWWRLTDFTVAELLPECHRAVHLSLSRAAHLILTHDLPGSEIARHALVQRFVRKGNWLSNDAPERRAARYLLHLTADRMDLDVPLFLQGPETHAEWRDVAAYVLEQSAEEWRLLHGWIDLNLRERESLGVSIIDSQSAMTLLGELGPQTDFSDLQAARRMFLLEECDSDLVRKLAIHELVTGALTAANERVFLEADFRFGDVEEQQLWEKLAGRSWIVRLQSQPMLIARQREVFEDRVVDAHGIVQMAVAQKDDAGCFWPLILSCLAKLGTPRAEIRDHLVDRSLHWLPLESGIFVAAADVISIPCADVIIHGLLSAERSGAVSVLALDRRVHSHTGFTALRSQILPGVTAALSLLALALQGRGDCTTGLTTFESAAELKEWVEALEGFDHSNYPLLRLLRKLIQDPPVAEKMLQHLNQKLAGALAQQATPPLLDAIARICEGGRQARASLIQLHQRALECAFQAGQWEVLCKGGLRLRNRAGAWKPANELVHAFEGVSDDYLVVESVGSFLAVNLPDPLEAPEQDGKIKNVSVATYAKDLARFAPGEIVGLFVALLGGTHENQRLASRYLHGMDVREMIMQVIPPSLSDAGRSVLDVWGRMQFFPEVLCGQTVVATSLAGTILTIPLAQTPPTLLYGEYILKATATISREGGGIDHRLQLLDLAFFKGADSEDDWIDRIIGTLRLLLKSRYGQRDFTGLNTLVQQLNQTRGRWGIRVAQRMVLKAGDQLIQTLGVHQHPALRHLLTDWQKAKQLEAQVEEGFGAAGLYETSRSLTKAAEDKLRELLSESPEIQVLFREAMRRKITGFQYFPDSVLFELFQNADDAYVEQGVISGIQPEDMQGEFRIERGEGFIRVIHHGRPINQPDAEENGRDLQKMLLLNASDKEAQLPEGATRTGRFGLGFKSVHLVSDEPVVVSGELAFVVYGGVYPERMDDGALRDELQGYPHTNEVAATVIHLALADTVPEDQVLTRFAKLSPVLPIFAKSIRSLSISGTPEMRATWRSDVLSFFDRAEIGTATGVPGKLVVLRAPITNLGEARVVLLVSTSGFSTLPACFPALWATAPLDVEGEMCLAINGPFDIDAGRRQLAAKSERNPAILEAGREALGSWLVALAQQCRANWEETKVEIGLSPEVSLTEFWTSFWKCLPQPQHAGESPSHAAVKTVLFHGEVSGCGRVLLTEKVLPTQLGSTKRLVAWPEVLHSMGGILEECADLFDSLWPEEGRGSAISETHVMRRLRQWFPDLALGHIRQGSLRDLLLVDSGGGEYFRFNPASASRFGEILTEKRIEQLEKDSWELFSDEWQRLAEELAEARFKTKSGEYRRGSEIMVPAGGPEERLRCGFAPESSILNAEYSDAGVRFFLLCRGELQVGKDELIEWARDASGVRLAAVLRFLLEGDARVRDGMVKVLDAVWIQRIEVTPEFLVLPPDDQRSLLLWFRHRIEIQHTTFPALEDEIIHTTPERLLEWWEVRGQGATDVRLTDRWGQLLFGDLLENVNAESVAEALRNPGDGNPVLGDHVWFRTLCVCSLLATRTPHDRAGRFFEELRDNGFFQRIQPATAPEDDQAVERELRAALDEIMQQPLEGDHGRGEDAELWRRMFYDARKMYRLVYLNQFPSTLLDVVDHSTDPRGVIRFLRSGDLLNQPRFVGVVGQSFKSPLFLLTRELRRLRVIGRDLFDPTCFYVCAPVRRAAARLGIQNNLTGPSGDLTVDEYLQSSEALHRWVSGSTVAHEYLTRCFDLPFYALEELNGYEAIHLRR